eukprot:Skav225045  [mRNA]  locus=scaffold2061:393681:397053:+ [translate_table: standard]
MWALLEVTKNGKIGPEDVGIVQLGIPKELLPVDWTTASLGLTDENPCAQDAVQGTGFVAALKWSRLTDSRVKRKRQAEHRCEGITLRRGQVDGDLLKKMPPVKKYVRKITAFFPRCVGTPRAALVGAATVGRNEKTGRHLHRHLGILEPVDFVRFTRGPETEPCQGDIPETVGSREGAENQR